MKTSTIIATVSAAASVNSIGYDLGDLDAFSLHCVFSGTDVSGTVKLQCSNENTTWVDVPNESTNISNSAEEMFNIFDAEYRYVRVNWTYISGTGNMTCYLVAKEPFKQST